MAQKKDSLGVGNDATACDAAKGEKQPPRKRTDFIRLDSPAQVLLYAQRLINKMRRQELELEPEYLGKIIYLLNTWISAYKVNLEAVEVQQLREEIAEMRRQLEARDRGSVIRSENR